MNRLRGLLPVALAVMAVWGLWRHEFLRYDWDWMAVAANLVEEPGSLFLPRLEPFEYLRIRPVLELSYAGPSALWGPRPEPQFMLQALLHVLNVFLVWRVALLWLETRAAALCAAAVFAVWWPGREAFLYLYGRSQLLGAGLMLLAALADERVRAGRSGRWPTAVAVAAALAAHEGAVAIVPILLLAGWWREGRMPWRRQAPVLAVASGWFLVQWLARLTHAGTDWAWLKTMGPAWTYLKSVASMWVPVPDHQAWDALTERFPGWFSVLHAPGGRAAPLIVLVALGSAWALWRGTSGERFGAAWVALCLIPTCVIPGGSGRYLYPAAAGMAIWLARMLSRIPGRGVAAAVAGLLVAGHLVACRLSAAMAEDRGRSAVVLARDVRSLLPTLAPGRPVIIWDEEQGAAVPLGNRRLPEMFRVIGGRGWSVSVRTGPFVGSETAQHLRYRDGRLTPL